MVRLASKSAALLPFQEQRSLDPWVDLELCVCVRACVFVYVHACLCVCVCMCVCVCVCGPTSFSGYNININTKKGVKYDPPWSKHIEGGHLDLIFEKGF